MSDALSISFEGAARTVTGSRHRIRYGERQFLFDCGIYQGHRDEAERVNRTFRFEPAEINTVVLSHAHLDHAGNLPTLVARGYGGRIHAPARPRLCRPCSRTAHSEQRDVEHVNRPAPHREARKRCSRRPTWVRTLERFEVQVPEPGELFPGVRSSSGMGPHSRLGADHVRVRDGARTFRLA